MAGAALHPDAVLARPTLPIGSTGTGSDGRTYEILAIIERGGMGELFLARVHRPGLAPQYAVVKRLLADLLEDDKYNQMFASEAKVMSELDHPNIVRVIDTPLVGNRQCLAMEFVRGRNVHQMLARCMELGTHIPPEIALAIMIQVLRGLDYAHRYRMKDGTPLELVHRDVTPGNVLVSFAGEVKLTDFGIAKSRMSMVSTTVGIVKGKARYLSPEQILGEAATPRSDIFASAAVVCEMLTGVPAFDRGSVPKTLYAIVNGEMPDLERTLPFRAPILVETIRRALAPKPEDRTQTAIAFAEELEACARAFGPLATTEDIGRYIRNLFENVHDPLAEFFEDAEAETVHGFKPSTPRLPSFPYQGNRALSDPAHEDEEPTNAMEEAEETDSSRTATPVPPQIVRGTPLDPPKPPQEVDEALSALERLHTESAERHRTITPILSEIAREAAVVAEDARATRIAPAFVAPKNRMPLVFAAGALVGVLGTVSIQAIFSESEPDDEDAELVLEAVEAQGEAKIAEPPPVETAPLTASAKPIERPTPPPAPRLATLDILYPRGARARIDGKLLQSRIPIRGIRLSPGAHSVRIWKGKYRREMRFDVEPGRRYVIVRELREVRD